eukprot:9909571-Prorocentrum_lima.AAC.1
MSGRVRWRLCRQPRLLQVLALALHRITSPLSAAPTPLTRPRVLLFASAFANKGVTFASIQGGRWRHT